MCSRHRSDPVFFDALSHFRLVDGAGGHLGKLGSSIGTVGYAIRVLYQHGCAVTRNFRKSGVKGMYLCALNQGGVPEKVSLATAFLGLKLDE